MNCIDAEALLDQLKNSRLVRGAQLQGTSLARCSEPSTHMVECEIVDTDFSEADLEDFKAENCRFLNCKFLRTNLKSAEFSDCSFYDSKRDKGCDFSNSILRHAAFVASDISLCKFVKSEMFQIKIHQCRAKGADFSRANFANVVSRNVVFAAAELTASNFTYSNFSGTYLEKCDLSESKLIHVDFSRANLEGADLTGCELLIELDDGLSICNADLRNAEIRNVNIRKLDMSGVKIFAWQQYVLMEQLGIIVSPDN